MESLNFTSLNELVNALKKRSKTGTAKEKTAGPETAGSETAEADVSEVISKLRSMKITVIDEKYNSVEKGNSIPVSIRRGKMTVNVNNESTGRIFLKCNRQHTSDRSIIYAECNGAVIDTVNWNLLVAPIRSFTPKPSIKHIDKGLQNDCYDIIKIRDGTILSLYYWETGKDDPKWCLSSSNGYDVSSFKWRGEKTYARIVYELLNNIPNFTEQTKMTLSSDSTQLHFLNLPTDRSYTFGFRHNDFHPISADPNNIWNIHSTFNNTVSYDKGLPLVDFQQKETFDKEVLSWKFLNDNLCNSLDDAKKMISSASDRKDFRYGYILRSKNVKVTGYHSDIICESDLLKRVKYLMYRRPSPSMIDKVNETNRSEYYNMMAFLNTRSREDYVGLMPDIKEKFAMYETFISNIVHLIIKMQRQNALPGSKITDTGMPNTPTKTIARSILSHIITHEKQFNPFKPNAKEIVLDFVLRPEYTLVYLTAMGFSV